MDTPSLGQTLNRKDSQATLISLLQLDPYPIDSPSPSTAAEETSFSDVDENTAAHDNHGSSEPAAAGTATSHLGLSSGRSSIYYRAKVTRIQKYSSYATGIFTALHLVNVSLIPAVTQSVAGSETYLLMTRELYQTSVAEPVLVALPVALHVASGLALRLLRRWHNMKRYGGGTPGMHALHAMREALSGKSGESGGRPVRLWPPLSYISISGYALTLFYGAHVFVNRVLPLAVEGNSSNIGLAYVAHGFARHPVMSGLAYVGLLATAGGHMVWGAARWFGMAPSTQGWRGKASVGVDKTTRTRRMRKWLALHGLAVGFAALWAIGGLGVLARGGPADGWVASVYDGLFERVGM
ncbi:N2,N2-dimethylguanosine tRNA methyltransferase [Metarhizium album ARSEF 1941]|uniref:N2,N2-dimethylguanosine tRNA methyltransferase n=1 Tax=Metarhizium album (strain ARSEF 1941) TaxID=1081103 RepID=A0A0B2WL62_METAS|nr:N2,N2-dimethylguanosine tRNA methyltransferase [Metarhizium album ARSEF 1941]KHN94434.1 N2,N2-dimethylguanosine tRNA methyltransferase [Metarhizium album ARSEF 1941]